MPSDQDLMKRMRAGDSAAFDVLFERYGLEIRTRLFRIVNDDAAAEDLLQEVFLRLWTRADQWQERGPLIGWLLRMAANLALNYQRSMRLRRHQPLEFPGGPTNPDRDDDSLLPGRMIDTASLRPDQILERAEQAERLRTMIDALPQAQRDVIRMVHEAEMDIREVAGRLGIPPGTVKSRLHYARNELARELKHLTEEENDQ